jgi:hypothetical protein
MRIATFGRVPTSHRTAHTRVHPHQSEPPRQGRGSLSPMTLTAASLASVISAVVVSHIWGPGTLYGAAATPIIVALVSEALQRPRGAIDRPRRVIETARTARSFDPLEEGRRGLREGDFATATPGDSTPPDERSVHRVTGAPVPRRRSVVIAVVTGVLAFAVAAFILTGTELVFGHSSVGGVSSRTTLFGGAPAKHEGKASQKSSGDAQKTQQTKTSTTAPKATPTTTPTTSTPTTTTPTTPTTAPSQTPTNGVTTTPQGQAPAPTTTPAPPAGQPPAQTTPAPTGP